MTRKKEIHTWDTSYLFKIQANQIESHNHSGFAHTPRNLLTHLKQYY